jgi:hypothetical protein
MQHQVDRKNRTIRGRSEGTLYSERTPETRGRVRSDPSDDEPDDDLEQDSPAPALELEEGIDLGEAKRPRGRPPGWRRPQPPPQDPDDLIEDTRVEIDYASEKMRSATALNKARLAAMVKATIPRAFVDQVISLIGTSISDHLITIGDRISPDLAALAGSTEASVVRQIKESIDEDISAALHAMQRVIADRYERALEEQS